MHGKGWGLKQSHPKEGGAQLVLEDPQGAELEKAVTWTNQEP